MDFKKYRAPLFLIMLISLACACTSANKAEPAVQVAAPPLARPVAVVHDTDFKPAPAIPMTNIGNLYFNTGVVDLGPNARRYIAGYLKDFQTAGRITIHGHADPQEQNGAGLAEQRAANTANYLVELRIPADKIRYRGFGSTQPAHDNKTADGRRLNRRVVITLQ